MIRDVVLHGKAAELFGERYRLDVSSLAEACRALGSQIRGFRAFLIKNDWKVVLKNAKGKMHLHDEAVGLHLPEGELHVVPYVQGGKSSGIGKVIAGVLIAAVAWYAAPSLSAALVGGITYGNVALLGIGLAFVGVSQLLTKKQNSPQDEQSFVLSGQTNTIAQGGTVPLIYGHTLVGSVVVSSYYTADDIVEGYLAGSTADRVT